MSMSERYLIDCSKEKITGQKSHKSTVEIGRAAPGSHVCRECNKEINAFFKHFEIFQKINETHSVTRFQSDKHKNLNISVLLLDRRASFPHQIKVIIYNL